ncbi:hypothetical protein EB796_004485 [Bugula neritina]|uniref:Ionotropic glutamate receptor C-terminal domain-containing protein n=1 Tax=Bugula neritina TaxID=10212 RepID=A0A7J7KIB5_BUGNE|nr:hypothetical protein EB796_004485 [Bugula neritina]
MTFGIAILYKVPEKAPPHLLTFMEPISLTVWGTIIASVVVVSFGMYIFSRFSPTEWENPFPCQENYGFLENQFNLSNAFWFSVGSIMQQGCDIMPKAPSTRIIAIAWWLFTLIIISSYTANLAAFLTITTLSDTFKSAEELEAQTEVTYGCKKNGNTCSFFENSKIPLYQRMWERISTSPDAFSSDTNEGIARVRDGNYAFLMESPYIQYNTNTDENCELTQVGPPINSLSYGIGLKTGHEYRDRLSSIILSLSEKQDLLELYNKWWKVNDNKCGIFVFLIGGLGIAIVILCIEVLVYAVKRSKQDRMSTCEILSLWLKSSVKGTFPASTSNNSLDRYSMSLQGKMTLSSARPSITQAIKEEDEPQSEQTNKRQENTTTSIILTPSQI